jgi:UDP-N-acetylglucosamine--N-acetylmuramyl-(pentapeptide) pyrophosphoryl-undecaprenol N-acetylglucosamine transferase
VVTGSSGGHIFPALSLLDSLKEQSPEIETLLLLPKRSIKNQIGDFKYPVRYVSFSTLKLSLDPRNILSILRFLKGASEELLVLWKFRPAVVVGFGSLASLPLILFARAAGIKTIIHEQNVIPGRANRFLAFFSNSIALSFTATKNYLKCPVEKIVVTGNPLRQEIRPIARAKARDYFRLNQDRFTILVSGGSQGSQSINSGFLKIAPLLAERYSLQVIHSSGGKDYAAVQQQYRKARIEARVYSFLSAMQYAYSASDLVISRAGATTIAELMLFKIPALLVPYPYAYKHQLANARVLAKQGCAVLLDDAQFTGGEAREVLEKIIGNNQELEKMRNNYKGFDADKAVGRLRDAVLALV